MNLPEEEILLYGHFSQLVSPELIPHLFGKNCLFCYNTYTYVFPLFRSIESSITYHKFFVGFNFSFDPRIILDTIDCTHWRPSLSK